ncbi:tubulin-like doman-containing protein [Methylobrevis albus]|uniref:Tubulin like n=1 Tax=Methylobrevis albus TaxID=2793297 RepID=A0A931I485_9HYPH|nr:tubulin-like doman-containing protein [Methylobrevis albus]MBH0238573.1 hypothetical protein [Methylobrevis albus]
MAAPELRPTLIVGIGGTGCEIAERVYSEAAGAHGELASRVAVMGLDTDQGDMAARGAIPERNRIRFSSTDTVYQIMRKHPSVEARFSVPQQSLPDTLLNMRLIEGAAQIRMFSHMALYTRQEIGNLQRQLGAVLAQIARNDARTRFEGVVNVIVTGSLAGATGSGSFVQIALLLRREAEERGIKIHVSGVFMLPDVFIKAAGLGVDQIDNVRANGYASLRELNAAIARAEGHPSARGFQYEFAPGLFLADGELPFRSITLIDYENVTGGNLGPNIAHYKAMVARAVFLQIFTPIGDRTASRTINDAQAKLGAAAAETSNMYAGMGICGVIYPAEEVADYLVLRLAREMITGDWLRLDRSYQQRLRAYDDQRAAGATLEPKPQQGESFLGDLDQLALRERHPFFGEIRAALVVTGRDQHGEETARPLTEIYLGALLGFVRDSFWATTALADIRARPPFGTDNLKPLARLETQVRQIETMLDADLRAVDAALIRRPEDIAISVFANEDTLAAGELRAHHLGLYLHAGGQHPVQARLFLFGLARAIDELRRRTDPAAARKLVLDAGALFDREADAGPAGADRSRPRSNPAILTEARRHADPSLFDRLRRRQQTFIETYVDYANASATHIRSYAEATITTKVLDVLAQEVDTLLGVYARMFGEIGKVLERLGDDVERAENRHVVQGAATGGNLFLHASPAAKRAAFDDLRRQTAALRLDEAANGRLNEALYRLARAASGARAPKRPPDLGPLFTETVIDGFVAQVVRRDQRRVWDFPIIEAARREADLEGSDAAGDWRELLRRAVDIAAAQARPFLTLDDPGRGQNLTFWAMSPRTRADYGDDGRFDVLFSGDQGTQPLEEAAFADTELLCVSSRVNLSIEHLAKFNPPPVRGNVNEAGIGAYHRAYAARIDRLIAEELVLRQVGTTRRYASVLTPHIHRDWHRGGHLPEIHPELQLRQRLDAAVAFLVALGLGLLSRQTSYDRPVAEIDVAAPGMPAIRDQVAATHDPFELWAAFRERTDLQRAVLADWQARLAGLAPVADPATDPLVAALAGPTLLSEVIAIGTPRIDVEARMPACLVLLQGRRQLLETVVRRLAPQLDAPGRADLAERIDAAAVAAAFAATAAAGLREETARELRALVRKAAQPPVPA